MKTYDELMKMQHKQCIQNMKMHLDNKMQDMLKRKAQYENALDNMKTAVETVGCPDFDKYSADCIVDTTYNNMLELKRVEEQIEVLKSTIAFLNLYTDNQVLKG